MVYFAISYFPIRDVSVSSVISKFMNGTNSVNSFKADMKWCSSTLMCLFLLPVCAVVIAESRTQCSVKPPLQTALNHTLQHRVNI